MSHRVRRRLAPVVLALAVAPALDSLAWSQDTELSSCTSSLSGISVDDQLSVIGRAACDLNGDSFADLLLAAPFNDTNAADAGTVYVYYGPTAPGVGSTVASADCELHGESAGDLAGFAIDAGDVDGDGTEDLVVGAPLADCGGIDSGVAYVIFGESAGWGMSFQLSAADLNYCGDNTDDQAGYSVSILGDIDGDGKEEIGIGAPFNDEADHHAGKVCLLYGQVRGAFADGSLSDCDTSLYGHDDNVLAGGALSGAGDVDGDGLDDILVGNAIEGGSWDGWTYLLFGDASGWNSTINLSAADASYVGESPGDDAGNAVAGAGDVNGDGFDDFLIGAPYHPQIGNVGGKAYLIFGKSAGWSTGISLSAADASFIAEDAGDTLGWSVNSAGDVNADGLSDFLLGAPGNGEYEPDAGQVYLFLGTSSGWVPDMSASLSSASFIGEATLDGAGRFASAGGDINADGFDDVLISASFADENYNNDGSVYILLGTTCVDSDGDGFGDPGDPNCPSGGALDCDDSDPFIHPGATESCNGIDDDCDGSVPTDEADDDGDDYRLCEGDCDDAEPDVHPDAGELCDGLDNDCDEEIPTWDEDQDGDGTSACAGDCHDGDPTLHVDDEDGDGVSPCDGDCDDDDAAMHPDDLDLDGFSPCDGDCDDGSVETNPDAEEICNGIDDDCDGELLTEEVDGDVDGVMICEGDCDDGEPESYPGAVEICDGLDNDCNGETDEIDADGDGVAPYDCGGDDCDDGDPAVNPMAPEDCTDLIDNDCDGAMDDEDEECEPATDDDDHSDVVGDDDTSDDSTSEGCECGLPGDSIPPESGASGWLVFGAVLWLLRRR